MAMANIADKIGLEFTDNSQKDESFGRGGVKMSLGDGATVIQGSGNNRSHNILSKIIIIFLQLALFIVSTCWIISEIRHDINDQTTHTDIRFDTMAGRVETAKADILKNRQLSIENQKSIISNSLTLKLMCNDYADLDKREKISESAWIWMFRRDILTLIDSYVAKGEITQKDLEILQEEIDYYRTVLGGNHDVNEKWKKFQMKITSQKIKVKD